MQSENMSRSRVVPTKEKPSKLVSTQWKIKTNSSHLSHAINYRLKASEKQKKKPKLKPYSRSWSIGRRVSSCRFWISLEKLVSHYEFVRWLAQSQSQVENKSKNSKTWTVVAHAQTKKRKKRSCEEQKNPYSYVRPIISSVVCGLPFIPTNYKSVYICPIAC